MYIGHLPKGFEEQELRKFFTQFGEVTKLRVSRSKKTGRSKGYAFVEFADKEIANTASDTMDGYLMFGKKVQCHAVDAPHKDTFKHGNREWNFVPNQLIFRNKKNKEAEDKTPEQKSDRVKGLLQKEKEKRIRLKELGMEYEFPGYQAIIDSQVADKPAFRKAKSSSEEKISTRKSSSDDKKEKKDKKVDKKDDKKDKKSKKSSK